MKFELTDEELKKAKEIINRIDKELHEKHSKNSGKRLSVYGACGGGWSYIFTPTSIGMFVSIKNCLTNETFDITDLDKF